ncbi:MAG TPA: DinB family protein [Candidatus Acidoferrales bacterium]|nr:DinB family protein [Candidatus Acidoferrales bacterium]
MAQPLWFERKFDFSFPVELYPEIIERLRGTPARLEERVENIEAGRLTARDGDKWSIQENIGHLSTSTNFSWPASMITNRAARRCGSPI